MTVTPPNDLVIAERRSTIRTGRHRSGVLLLLIAFLIPVLLAIVGFAVDLAFMQLVRSELRVVADIAAKTAAHELSATQSLTAAQNAAIAIAAENEVGGVAFSLASTDIEFGRSTRQTDGTWAFNAGGTPENTVRVTARRDSNSADGAVPLFFGRFYGRTTFEPILSSTASFLDLDVCLVLDRSSSMKLAIDDTAGFMSAGDPRACEAPRADSRWVALAGAVQLFLNRLNATAAPEHVATVTFASDDHSPCGETNTTASIDQHLDPDLTLCENALAARSSSIWNGNTEIDDGIRLGTQVLTDPTRSRTHAQKVMIVFTDGNYTGTDPAIDAANARNEGIVVHTITYSSGAAQTDMQRVAVAGGGQHYHAPDVASLNAVFQRLAATLAILTE